MFKVDIFPIHIINNSTKLLYIHQGMVHAFYKDELAVLGDWELQDWVKDIFENGFGKMEGTREPSLGIPSKINTRKELVDYLQRLIYTDTVRHTFANFYTFQ